MDTLFINQYLLICFSKNQKYHRKTQLVVLTVSLNEMKSLLLLVVLLHSPSKGHCQQCRYVTVPVCDDNPISPPSNNIFSTKGDKGDRGFSGKMGPIGENGSKGGKGEKGDKGSTVQVEELQQHLSRRIDGTYELILLHSFISNVIHKQYYHIFI